MPHALIEQPANRDHQAPVLLVEAAPGHKIFLQNVSDLFWPARQPSLQLSSGPGEFWPDVFVASPLPWNKVPLSVVLHIVILISLIAIPRLWPQPVQVVDHPEFNTRDVISFSPSEYLPPLDTGGAQVHAERRGDPAYSPQPIISVPPEADNHSQTIVAPPKVKLGNDVPMPNVIAWKQTPPAVPIAATENIESRKALVLPFAVVAPAPELTHLASQRVSLLQPSAVAPQPQVPMNAARRLDEINIAHQQIVAPAPQLPMTERHTAAGINNLNSVRVAPPQPTVNVTEHRQAIAMSRSAVIAPAPTVATSSARRWEGPLTRAQVVAPAPNMSQLDKQARNRIALSKTTDAVPPAPSSQNLSAKNSDRQLIALNLHPSVTLARPEGNRRGTFAATPQGGKDASGKPDRAVTSAVKNPLRASSGNNANALPPGLHVGDTEDKKHQTEVGTGHDQGSGPGSNAADHPLVASVTIPRVTSSSHPAKEAPASSASELDRRIFGGHKFYAMAMNFANLNSGGGSWIFHFAEMAEQKDAEKGDLMAPEVEREVDPAYPTELMRHNVHGTVVLSAVIGSDGSLSDIKILESVDTRLDQYASQALGQWRFRPATRNGNPVVLTMVVKVPFRPARNLF